MKYHIVNTGNITGEIVRDGRVIIRRYELLCRLHEPTIMVDLVQKDGSTIEISSKCPVCGITILQGFYMETPNDPEVPNLSN
jgi:hypothetical protein